MFRNPLSRAWDLETGLNVHVRYFKVNMRGYSEGRILPGGYCVFLRRLHTHDNRMIHVCSMPTPGHPSAADETWHWSKPVLHPG